jgi:hypothetical protein
MDGWLIIEYIGANEDQSRPAMKLQIVQAPLGLQGAACT